MWLSDVEICRKKTKWYYDAGSGFVHRQLSNNLMVTHKEMLKCKLKFKSSFENHHK